MDENFEELKKTFIIDDENFEEKKLSEMIGRINKICQIDKSGHVFFLKENLGDKEKIKYILIARFLANKLGEKIPKEVTNDEFERIMGKSKDQIRARLSDLRKEIRNPIKDINKNTHEIKPLFVHKILGDENEKKEK